MSNIQIYNEDKQSWGEISFIRDVKSQLKIRDIESPIEFSKQLGMIMSQIINHLAIKNPVTDIQKADIKELILMRFKHLSLDEVCYAFKLERFGVLGDKTSHFQLFNADYVSEVLGKYIKYRQKLRFDNNLVIEKVKEKDISDQEKTNIENSAVKKFLDYFIEHREVDVSRIYVYDILYGKGYLPTSLIYKNEVKKDAILILSQELKEKKATTRDENKEIQRVLQNLSNEPMLKIKCKELVLAKFFRDLTRDEEPLKEFKQKFT